MAWYWWILIAVYLVLTLWAWCIVRVGAIADQQLERWLAEEEKRNEQRTEEG